MSTTSRSSGSNDPRLDRILTEYVESVESGSPQKPDDWAARYPEFALELRDFISMRRQFDAAVQNAADELVPSAIDTPTLLGQRDVSDGSDASTALPRVRYFGDYELLEEIARGGMGVVYKARQVNLKRIVALKMILSGQFASDDDVRRFHAEAEAAAKLQHPHIVPIFEIGKHDEHHYFSMAYVEGQSLARTAASGPLPPGEAARLMQKVAEAVAYAHVEGVVHRDLKPANVLLDRNGEPHVTDFGLAKRIAVQSHTSEQAEAASSFTVTGQVLGTPSYMPPEQAAGKASEVGPLSDVYSLGALLYCLLTGRPPFQAASPLDTLMQVLDLEPVPPRQLNPQVPKDLETICLKCLEKKPGQRYAGAAALADDLRRYLNDEPIEARPVGVAERGWRWLRKQRRSAVVGTAAAAAAVVLVFAGIAAWQSYERSQLGYLQLTSASSDSPVLVAEVFDEQNELAAAPFTVPTKEPVPLMAGSYRVRLSGSGQLSETYQMEVNPGSERTYSVGLGERKLFAPVSVGRPDGFEAVNLDGSVDLILMPQGLNPGSVRRVSVATGKTVWEVSWDPWKQSNAALEGVLKTQEDRQQWARFVSACADSWSGLSHPVLLRTRNDFITTRRDQANQPFGLVDTEHSEPLPDLNGDGVGDLVWAISTSDKLDDLPVPPSLVAVSGKDGTPLWWFRAKSSSGLIRSGSFVGRPVIVKMSTGERRFVALLSTADESWIESISATSGESVWRATIDDRQTPGGNSAQLYELRLGSVAGNTLLIAVAGRRLVGLDAVTGEPAWLPHDLELQPVFTPQIADLDGDGSDDLLLGYLDSTQGRWLTAVSLATRMPLWPTPVQMRYEPGRSPDWPFDPYVTALSAEGKPVVVVPSRIDVPYNRAWTGLEVLDGANGARRWERRFPIHTGMIANMNRAADRYAAGPDLDGDGQRELFVVSARTDRTERGRDARHPSLNSLFVDALSGDDGHTIWRSRIPLGEVLPTTWTSGIGPISWGPPGADGRPSLVVPVVSAPEQGSTTSRAVYVLAAGTGQVLHVGHDLWPPLATDLNHDGITDLCAFVPDDPRLDLSGNLPNPAGKVQMIRGSPPEVWRRLGNWLLAQDLNGDGFTDLMEATDLVHPRQSEPIISGHDGRLLVTWKAQWDVPGISGALGSGRWYPLPQSHGDLNGDGVADLLFTATHNYFDFDRNRPFVDRPGRLFFPLQAISGRTGERLWLSQDIPDSVPGNHALLRVEPYSPTCDNLGGNATPEVLAPFSCHHINKGGGWVRIVGVSLISGKDGTVRWTQMLEEETVLAKGERGIATSEFTPVVMSIFVDLNADGVRDVLLTAPIKPDRALELHALDGLDGRRLWQRSLVRRWEPNFFPNESPQPLCGDIDGDGKPEVIVLDDVGTSVEGWLTYTVTALDGRNGVAKWTWEYKDHGNLSRPRAVLADLDGDGFRSVCIGLHESGPKNEIVVLGSDGKVQQRFDSGGQVVNNYATSTSEIRIHTGDLDGDGKDEIVYVTDGKVRATRGGPDQSLWEWPLPGGTGGVLEIRREAAGRQGTLVVEAAGESTIDEFGRNLLISMPTRDGVGIRGDSIYILDGVTGQPLLRGRRDATGYTTIPALGYKTLVSYSSDRTVGRLLLPAGPTGEYLPPPIVASALQTLAADPRVLRRLPWVPPQVGSSGQLAVEFLKPPFFMGIWTVLVFVAPGWLLWHAILLRRRTWRGFLLVPVALAIGFVGYKFGVELPIGPHGEALPSSLPLRMLAALAGLPVVALPTLLVIWTIRRRWSNLLLLLGLSLLTSLTIAAVVLWIDSRSMDSTERYLWDGWYLVLVIGSVAASALTLAGLVLARIAHMVRTRLRRTPLPV